MRLRRLACCALALPACVYSFDNPVEALPSGTIAGQLALQQAAPGQTFDGGTIKLAWSGLSVPLSASGRFAFLDLPDGTYTLVYTIPGALPGDPPFLGLRRDVVVPSVNGVGDAVDLGTLEVAPAGSLVGVVSGGRDPLQIALFAELPDGGSGPFEGYSTTTSNGGRFELAAPVGDHLLVASSASEAASATVSVAALQTTQLPDLALAPALPDGGGRIVGHLIFGGPGRGAEASGSTIAALTQSLSAAAFPPLAGSLATQRQVKDVGVPFIQPMLPGRPYDFVCTLQVAQGAPDDSTFDPLSVKDLPVVAGRLTDLGPVPWLPRAVFDANQIEQVIPGWTGSTQTSLQGGASTCGGGPAGTVVRVVPVERSGGDQTLVWSTDQGAVAADDLVGCGPVGSTGIAPASLQALPAGDGGLVAGWLLSDGGAQITLDVGGAWVTEATFDAGTSLALAAGGAALLATGDPDHLALALPPTWTAKSLAVGSGQLIGLTALAATACRLDGVDAGLCFAWTGRGLRVGLADEAAGTLVGTALLSDGGAADPSIASFVDATNGTPYLAVTWVEGGEVQWAYLGSILDPTLQAVEPLGQPAAGPAALLPWRGLPLAVFEPAPGAGLLATALPTGAVPSPVFPPDAGTAAAPAGAAAADGGLVLGIVDGSGSPAVLQLAP